MLSHLKYSVLLALLCCLASIDLLSQENKTIYKEQFRYEISPVESAIKVDGILDEAIWQEAQIGTDFWQKIPYFKEGADPKTEFMMSYDDQYLYVATRCYQEKEVLVQSLRRDDFWNNDGIAVILDPLDSRANSVMFGTTGVGVQWDAVRTETSDINANWSNKWFVETQQYDGYWTSEFAIPFRILRYNQSLTEWGLNFVRNNTNDNEFHNWTSVPEGFWPPNPAFSGALVWSEPPNRKKGNFNLIPYVTGGVSKQKDTDTKLNYNAGLDARIALSSALNLDLTLNPDFSQIEVDELVTNLTRFNIQLPEKRTFFLENADLFSDFGTGGMRPFFSRRIGLDENLQAVPIRYGARLTGNVTQKTRIGVMNIHSGSTENALAQNQSAFSARRQFGRSFIQGMFLNRQAFDGSETVEKDYGRNISLEGLYTTENGQVSIWGATHRSFKDGYTDKNMIFNFGTVLKNQNWEFLMDNIMLQDNFFADMGFLNRVENYDAERDTIIRQGYNSSYSYIDYLKRPRKGIITGHRFGFENLTILQPDWSFNEQFNRLRYFVSFQNTSEIRIRLNYNVFDLLYPFSFTGATPFPVDRYQSADINLEYDTDRRKPLSWNVSATAGGFYNGSLNRIETNLNYRVQYWGNFSVGYQLNDLKFPDPYGEARITALVSKVEIGFNKNLIWTTLFQFVDQSDFMGINSRIQWRFSPMSDIFLVYLDNYDVLETMGSASTFNSNNRALILKANYWY